MERELQKLAKLLLLFTFVSTVLATLVHAGDGVHKAPSDKRLMRVDIKVQEEIVAAVFAPVNSSTLRLLICGHCGAM